MNAQGGNRMKILTAIGINQAEKGFEFVYVGPDDKCKDCKIKNICIQLKKGRRYRVIDIREKVHNCKVHEGGVKIVEVERANTESAVDKRIAIEGSTVTVALPKCYNMGCENRILCFPVSDTTSEKQHILKVKEELECPIGLSRVKVILE